MHTIHSCTVKRGYHLVCTLHTIQNWLQINSNIHGLNLLLSPVHICLQGDSFAGALRPHPLKKPPPPVPLAAPGVLIGSVGAFDMLARAGDRPMKECRFSSFVPGWVWGELINFRSASNLPFTSSSSCLATASAVFALTSSSSSDSSVAGL